MANDKNQNINPEDSTDFEEIGSEEQPLVPESISKNRKLLLTVIGGLAAVVIGYFAYDSLVLQPQAEEAIKKMGIAQHHFGKDSLDYAMNGDTAANPGMLEIIDNYSGTEAANLANYYAGITALKQGNYQQAIDYLESFETNSFHVKPMRLGKIGDAYAEMQQTDKAIEYYIKAAEAKDNELMSPRFYLKAGLLYEETGNPAKAVETYQIVKDNYADAPIASDIDKYLARAKVKAAQ